MPLKSRYMICVWGRCYCEHNALALDGVSVTAKLTSSEAVQWGTRVIFEHSWYIGHEKQQIKKKSNWWTAVRVDSTRFHSRTRFSLTRLENLDSVERSLPWSNAVFAGGLRTFSTLSGGRLVTIGRGPIHLVLSTGLLDLKVLNIAVILQNALWVGARHQGAEATSM